MYSTLRIINICLFFFIQGSAFSTQLFTIEGTTGAGKSTLLKLLAQEMAEIIPVYEPVEQVQDVGGHGNLLEMYYHDAKRWSYVFQTYAFLLQDELNSQTAYGANNKILIGDRSVFSTYYVFGKMLHESNIFTCLEWHIYKRWFNYAITRSSILPTGFIYLRTTPDCCFLRIKKRNRAEEQAALIDYYLQEYNFHEKWLIEKADIEHDYLKSVPVLILDGNLDFLNDYEVRTTMIQQIKEFIDFYKKKNYK